MTPRSEVGSANRSVTRMLPFIICDLQESIRPKLKQGDRIVVLRTYNVENIFDTIGSFSIRSSSNLSITRTEVNLGRVRFPDRSDYSCGSQLHLSAED